MAHRRSTEIHRDMMVLEYLTGNTTAEGCSVCNVLRGMMMHSMETSVVTRYLKSNHSTRYIG